MERNRDNFEDFGGDSPNEKDRESESFGDETPEFSQDDASESPERKTVIRAGDEWFDPMWLRANGARVNEDGEVERIGASALEPGRVPVLVLVEDALNSARPGEEMESRMRAWGAMAWKRRRAPGASGGGRVPTLLEQLDLSDRERRAWIEQNPFAVFWAATATPKDGPGRRRRSPRRGLN